MGIEDITIKKLLIGTGLLLGFILFVTNIVKTNNNRPVTLPVFPTAVPQSQTRPQNIFPTLSSSQVNDQLTDMLNNRATLNTTEQDAIATFSAKLAAHPYHGEDFQIGYSPMLNLFFIHKNVPNVDSTIKSLIDEPVLIRMYEENDNYRVFVYVKSSVDFARYAFEDQYNALHGQIPTRRLR